MAEKNTHGIVTSDSVAKARRTLLWRPSKKITLVAAVICGLLAIVAIGWLLWSRHQNDVAARNAVPVRSHIDIVSGDAMDQADAGDYSGAIVNLDQEIGLAAANKDKGVLAETKATLALNAKQYQDGLKFSQEAEAFNPTANSAYLIAANSEALGDKATALDYYKKALSRLDAASRNQAPDIVDMYKQKITELEK